MYRHPQHPGGLPDPLRQLRDLGAGKLGLHHLAAAHSQAREHGDREDDDPHSSEPLGELPPHRQRLRELVEVGDDARAGRRGGGHPFEVRVDRVAELVAARRRGRGATRKPPSSATWLRRRGTPRALRRRCAAPAVRRSSSVPGAARDRAGGQERPERLAVPERDRHREHEDARPRYFASIPTRLAVARTSTASRRLRPCRGARPRR